MSTVQIANTSTPSTAASAGACDAPVIPPYTDRSGVLCTPLSNNVHQQDPTIVDIARSLRAIPASPYPSLFTLIGDLITAKDIHHTVCIFGNGHPDSVQTARYLHRIRENSFRAAHPDVSVQSLFYDVEVENSRPTGFSIPQSTRSFAELMEEVKRDETAEWNLLISGFEQLGWNGWRRLKDHLERVRQSNKNVHLHPTLLVHDSREFPKSLLNSLQQVWTFFLDLPTPTIEK